MVFDLHRLINLDTTSLDALKNVHQALRGSDSRLILCETNSQPLSLMHRTGFLELPGGDACFDDISAALNQLKQKGIA